jgi:CheY-like chemotaxis protein
MSVIEHMNQIDFQHSHEQHDYRENYGNEIAHSNRVLIVDDDDIFREFIDQALTYLKFDVESVDNGQDALELFINEGFGLVLTDIQMPGMDGWELATKIKTASPNTPVILMTGMQKDLVEKKMRDGHADSVLYKPFKLNDVQVVVNDYLMNKEFNGRRL